MLNPTMSNLLDWIANAASVVVIGVAMFVLVSEEMPNYVGAALALSAAFIWIMGRAALYVHSRR